MLDANWKHVSLTLSEAIREHIWIMFRADRDKVDIMLGECGIKYVVRSINLVTGSEKVVS